MHIPQITRRSDLYRKLLLAVALLLAAPVVALVAAGAYFWSTTSELRAHRPVQPSRLYGAPMALAEGAAVDRDGLVAGLAALGYRRTSGHPALGEYRFADGRLTLGVRGEGTTLVDGPVELTGRILEVDLEGRRIDLLAIGGREVDEGETVDLGRPLLFSYHDDSLRECRPVALDRLPAHVVEAVLAAEDAKFFRHSGLAPVGIARAAWENVRAGEVRQGGSTITQQLVKNLYLTPRRTFGRKLHEAMLALLLEARYGKERILATYLDEIYWGRADGVNLHGIGAAARAYFDKEPAELDLAEAATLAGMIQAPADYSPHTAAEAARGRRDWVLGRMAARGWITTEEASAATASALHARRGELRPRRAPYFAAAMQVEAQRRFGIEELAGEGYQLLSTLSLADQEAAEREVRSGLGRLERAYPAPRGAGPLQAALLSLDPRDGKILAWVGGRDWGASQFDRVSQARRQAGSAFKPIVFAAALEGGQLKPWELLRDSPVLVRFDRTQWRPRNSDRQFHGPVTPRTALELSLNVPTVRVALRAGIPQVRATAAAMGVESPLPAVPALALGAAELTTLELGRVYATLAAGGRRPEAWGLEAVSDAAGELLVGDEVALPERVLSADVAYLVTSMLRGVVDRGTGWRARELGVRGPVAGKTGTTDDRRDNWFAGYSADRVTVVWVGYDANHPTRLSGSRGALPMWSRFVARVTPAEGYLAVPRPAGFVAVELDPDTGLLATPMCPRRVREEMPAAMAPLRRCDAHLPMAPLAAFTAGELPGAPPGERLGDLLTRSTRETPPVRLRGDVTRMFGAGHDIQVEGPGETLGSEGPAIREPASPEAVNAPPAPALAPSIVIEPASEPAAGSFAP